uniref:Helitron helicase-like domain-containing protein n=1 Tax=Daphnia galeata TaxID=27404 RepID=A0A8J2W1X1_9CRUS|nr:unnamed protein product [Daphnia galeata]
MIDQLVTPSAATDVTENLSDFSINNEINNSEAVSESENLVRIPLPASFVNRPPSIPIGHGNSATVAFRGLIASLTGESNESLHSEYCNTSPQKSVALQINRDSSPFNEFDCNDLLLYSTFPFLFLLGRGLKTTGSLSTKTTRHILLQSSTVFSSCFRFIFLLFDQLQRHAASRIVASRVKSDPKSFAAFASWIADPNFLSELKLAVANPLANSSVKLLKKITPHVDSCTAKIPYSTDQRKASMINLYSMVYYYGMPSIFFTFAPDDINGLLNLRMSMSQKDNITFPATGGAGLAEAILGNAPNYYNVPIDQKSLRVLLANGPVGAAECFRLLTDAIFGILLGTPTEASMKRNSPLFKKKAGIFGVPIATFGCTEEQARGSLHMHALFWGGLPPHLLQTAGGVPLLCSAVAKALDSMVCAQLDPITHVENLISKFSTEKKTFRPSLVSVHHPILQPELFSLDVQRAVAETNIHSHGQTCRNNYISIFQFKIFSKISSIVYFQTSLQLGDFIVEEVGHKPYVIKHVVVKLYLLI